MARKRTLLAINLIAPLALVATWFDVSVDADADADHEPNVGREPRDARHSCLNGMSEPACATAVTHLNEKL